MTPHGKHTKSSLCLIDNLWTLQICSPLKAVGNLVKDKHQKEIAEMPGDDLARRAIEIVVNKAESIQATVMATFPSVSRDSVSLHAMLYIAYTLIPALKLFDSNEEEADDQENK